MRRILLALALAMHTYEVGNIAYWPPSPDVAIFYRHDGQEIPDPGIIVIGKMDSGVEALNMPGSIRVQLSLLSRKENRAETHDENIAVAAAARPIVKRTAGPWHKGLYKRSTGGLRRNAPVTSPPSVNFLGNRF